MPVLFLRFSCYGITATSDMIVYNKKRLLIGPLFVIVCSLLGGKRMTTYEAGD